jgi:hypothetical protein
MAQAQIALETHRAPLALWQHVAAFLNAIRERARQRREVVRLLAQLDTGLASGARV